MAGDPGSDYARGEVQFFPGPLGRGAGLHMAETQQLGGSGILAAAPPTSFAWCGLYMDRV